MIRHRWEHHEVSGLSGFDCSCSRASFPENHQYHAHRRRAVVVEAQVAVGKTKPAKPPQPSITVRAGCNARFLLREVHDSGALSGARTGKGPQMANPRSTPKPGNLGPPWPPGTSGNMSSACSVLPRDLVSVEVAAQQVGTHPQTLLTRSTFPVRYPVLAPERGPRWQTHAQRRNLRISVRVDQVHVSGALSGACTGKGPQMANPRPTPKPGNWRPIRGWTKPLHERGMKADSMPERLLNGPGSPPSIDSVYPEMSPTPEPCRGGGAKTNPIRSGPGREITGLVMPGAGTQPSSVHFSTSCGPSVSGR